MATDSIQIPREILSKYSEIYGAEIVTEVFTSIEKKFNNASEQERQNMFEEALKAQNGSDESKNMLLSYLKGEVNIKVATVEIMVVVTVVAIVVAVAIYYAR